MRLPCPSNDEFQIQIDKTTKEIIPLVKKYGRLKITLRDIQKNTYDWPSLLKTIDQSRQIAEVNYLSNKDFFELYYKKQLSIYFIGANITRNDPFEILSFFRKKDYVNLAGIAEPYVDYLMEKAVQSRTSDEVRQYAQQANAWVINEGYALPLFSKKFRGCIQPNLSGYKITSLGPLSIDYSLVRIGNE